MNRTTRKPAVRLKSWALIAYFILLALAAVIGITWMDPASRFINLEAIIPGVYSHTSNLVLSFALVLAYGLVRILTRGTLVGTTVFAVIVVACNYGYELLLPLWNVKDPMDAHYGAIGALVALGYMALVHRYGATRATASHTMDSAT